MSYQMTEVRKRQSNIRKSVIPVSLETKAENTQKYQNISHPATKRFTFQRTIKPIVMESRIEMNAIIYKTSQLLIIFAFFFIIIIIIHRIITFPIDFWYINYNNSNNNCNPLSTSDLLSFYFSSFGRILFMFGLFEQFSWLSVWFHCWSLYCYSMIS